MLTIRPDQFARMRALAEEGFLDELIRLARREIGFWVEDLDPDILRERVRSGVARARSHGFVGKAAIARFVILMLRFAPNFDEYPPIRALLARRDGDPDLRAERLFTEITAEQWKGAEDRYDPYAWGDFASGEVL